MSESTEKRTVICVTAGIFHLPIFEKKNKRAHTQIENYRLLDEKKKEEDTVLYCKSSCLFLPYALAVFPISGSLCGVGVFMPQFFSTSSIDLFFVSGILIQRNATLSKTTTRKIKKT